MTLDDTQFFPSLGNSNIFSAILIPIRPCPLKRWLWASQESVDEMVGMVMGKVEGIKGTVGELKDKVFGKSIIQDQSQPWSLNDQCPQRGAGVYVLFYKRKKISKRWLHLGGCSCSNRGAERRARERNNDKKKQIINKKNQRGSWSHCLLIVRKYYNIVICWSRTVLHLWMIIALSELCHPCSLF